MTPIIIVLPKQVSKCFLISNHEDIQLVFSVSHDRISGNRGKQTTFASTKFGFVCTTNIDPFLKLISACSPVEVTVNYVDGDDSPKERSSDRSYRPPKFTPRWGWVCLHRLGPRQRLARSERICEIMRVYVTPCQTCQSTRQGMPKMEPPEAVDVSYDLCDKFSMFVILIRKLKLWLDQLECISILCPVDESVMKQQNLLRPRSA